MHASAVLPSEGLMAEADSIVLVAQAERDVRVAEQKLAKLRVRESLEKARLFKYKQLW